MPTPDLGDSGTRGSPRPYCMQRRSPTPSALPRHRCRASIRSPRLASQPAMAFDGRATSSLLAYQRRHRPLLSAAPTPYAFRSGGAAMVGRVVAGVWALLMVVVFV